MNDGSLKKLIKDSLQRWISCYRIIVELNIAAIGLRSSWTFQQNMYWALFFVLVKQTLSLLLICLYATPMRLTFKRRGLKFRQVRSFFTKSRKLILI